MSVTFNASTTSGIGITSDNSGAIQFQSNAANTVIINSSGYVGIGTTSPTQLLNLYAATSAFALIQGDAATNVTVNRSSTDASGPALNLRKARGTTSAQTAVASGDALGSLVFQAYGGTNNRSVSFVQGFVDTYTSDTNISSYLTFSTSPSGVASGTERMRIDSSGRVGINTTSPVAALTVSSGGSSGADATGPGTIQIRQTSSSLTDTGGLEFLGSTFGSGYGYKLSAIDSSGVNLVFASRANSATWTEHMRIDSSGNVGIGTASPASLLNISTTADDGNPTFRISGGTGNGSNVGQIDFYSNSGTAVVSSIKTIRDGGNNSGGLTFYTATSGTNTERMRINSFGYVFINETATVGTASWLTITAAASTVYGATIKDSGTTYASTTRYMNFLNSANAVAGSIQHTAATTTAFSTSSDARLKKNIVDAPSAIDIIANIPVRSYDWKEDNSHVKFGFVAQELEQIYAEPVGVGGDDVDANPWSIEYGRMTPILVKALQELKAEFDAYKATHP